MRISQRETDLSFALMARDIQCNALISAQFELLDKLQIALDLIEELRASNEALIVSRNHWRELHIEASGMQVVRSIIAE